MSVCTCTYKVYYSIYLYIPSTSNHILCIDEYISIYTCDRCTYHWCSSSLGEDMKNSKKGISRHALCGRSLCLSRFSTSFTSLTRPTSLSSLSSNLSRSASSSPITAAIRRYSHSPRCASASSSSGHQQVAQEHTEHRQLTATSAPSMLSESR